MHVHCTKKLFFHGGCSPLKTTTKLLQTTKKLNKCKLKAGKKWLVFQEKLKMLRVIERAVTKVPCCKVLCIYVTGQK